MSIWMVKELVVDRNRVALEMEMVVEGKVETRDRVGREEILMEITPTEVMTVMMRVRTIPRAAIIPKTALIIHQMTCTR